MERSFCSMQLYLFLWSVSCKFSTKAYVSIDSSSLILSCHAFGLVCLFIQSFRMQNLQFGYNVKSPHNICATLRPCLYIFYMALTACYFCSASSINCFGHTIYFFPTALVQRHRSLFVLSPVCINICYYRRVASFLFMDGVDSSHLLSAHTTAMSLCLICIP